VLFFFSLNFNIAGLQKRPEIVRGPRKVLQFWEIIVVALLDGMLTVVMYLMYRISRVLFLAFQCRATFDCSFVDFSFAPIGGAKCCNERVCELICPSARISQNNSYQKFTNFSVRVNRARRSDYNMICCVLLVLWMTSCLRIIGDASES